ncbi:MAG: hypothetical protein KDA37_03855, partial [Planctomycetales bacterium]|nr:hypothetical protein [Planctomycetales bacterium]
LAMLGATVLRELRRVASIDISQYYAQHAAAGEVGGWLAFVFFLLLNTLLILWVVWLVQPPKAVARSKAQ